MQKGSFARQQTCSQPNVLCFTPRHYGMEIDDTIANAAAQFYLIKKNKNIFFRLF